MKLLKLLLSMMMVITSSAVLAQAKGEMPFTSSSKNVNTLIRNSWVAYSDSKMEEGNKYALLALKEDPDCGMAYASLLSNTAQERQENLKKAETHNLSGDEQLLLRGLIARHEKKPTAEFFEPLLKKYPKDQYLHLLIMFDHSDKSRAVAIGENLVKRNPKFSPAYNLLGYAYMQNNDLQKAETNFSKYLSLRPDLANAYDSKGDFMLHTGKTEEAIALFEKAAALGMTFSKGKAARAKSLLKFPKLSDTDANTIKGMILSSFSAYKDADLEKILEPYSEQSAEIMESQMSNVGLANIRNRLKETYNYGSFPKQEITFEAVNGNGPIAVAYGKTASTWKSKESGKEFDRNDNAMFLMRRQDDGNWKILADHFYQAAENNGPLSESDKDQINQMYRNWEAVVKAGDIFTTENMIAGCSLFSSQAIEFLPMQRANVGVANIRARWEGAEGTKFERNEIGLISFEGLGRRAVAWGIGNQDFRMKDSEEIINNEFVWAMILTKEKDDVWRILAMHWTPN